MNTFEIIDRIREISPWAANAAMNRVIPHLIPLASGLEVRVRELTDTRCDLTMPLKRRTRNHVGSLYFGAQMMLADLSVGVLLFQRFPPGPFGGLIKRVEADFLAKAKGLIHCVCNLPDQVIEELEQVRSNADGRAEVWVPLSLHDGEGRVVAEVRFLVAVKRF